MSGLGGPAVGGLDGCRAGWVLALVRFAPGDEIIAESVEVRRVDTFAEALALVEDGTLAALAVDMPIGLPTSGARAADQAARRRLGPRRSSVFPTPVRAVLGAADHADAVARSRAVDGRGLSVQAFNLLPKIAEIDAALTPAHQDRVVESHPEVGFARLAGAPLAEPKRRSEGRAVRRALLDAALPGVGALAATPPPGSGADDVLDALVLALTARRVVEGRAEHLGDGQRDARGLRMEIVL